MIDNDVTLGEVYRLCQRIESKVDATNGRVSKAETEIAVLKDRGDQSRDGHARYAGWGGVLLSGVSLIWQSFHRQP